MTVVVTGAGRGLGRGVAVAMAQEGARVWACDKTSDELDTTSKLILEGRKGASLGTSETVETRCFDLTSADACNRFAMEVLEQSPRIDCLVNNAAILERAPFSEVTTEAWEKTMAVNLTAPFLLSQRFLRGMGERGGSIINVSSRAGVLGFARQASYCASKFGIEGLTRSLSEELNDAPISVNTITPGMRIKPTNLTDQQDRDTPSSERVWKNPALIAPAFVYLALQKGQPSGCRFDAERLAQEIRMHGYELSPERAEDIAE